MSHFTYSLECTDSSWRSLLWNNTLTSLSTRSWLQCLHLSSILLVMLTSAYTNFTGWEKSSFLQTADQKAIKEILCPRSFLVSDVENISPQVQTKWKNEHTSKYANLLWNLAIANENDSPLALSYLLWINYTGKFLFFLHFSFLLGDEKYWWI